jgi:hypothetical protein
LDPEAGADFSYIFFHGKSLSAEFLGKAMFQNFFRGKFHFFPTFWGENFPRNFPRNFPQKKCTKNRPQTDGANFRPMGDCFPQGGVFENGRSSQNILTSLLHGKSRVSILTKIGLGYILSDFLTFFYIFYIFFIWSPCPKGFPAKEEKDCRINTHSKSFLLELFFHW